MRATVRRWGNSLALRLPKHLADKARLAEGTSVQLEIDNGALRITPSRQKLTLSELLQGETPREYGSAAGEVDWGQAQGDEVW